MYNVDRLRQAMATTISQDERKTSNIEQIFARIIMDDQLDMLGVSTAGEGEWRADVIINLAEQGVALP